MILNGVNIESSEHLDSLMSDFNEETRSHLRSLWAEESRVYEMQVHKREYGQSVLNNLIDAMGERNQELIEKGVSVNVLGVAADNASVKLLIETGALGSAVNLCGMLKVKYPTHADIYNATILDFNNFLRTNGYV